MKKLLIAAVIAAASVAPLSAHATTQPLKHGCGIFLATPSSESCFFDVNGTSATYDRGVGGGSYNGTATITHHVACDGGDGCVDGRVTVQDWSETTFGPFAYGGACTPCFTGYKVDLEPGITYTLTLTGSGGVVAGAWEQS